MRLLPQIVDTMLGTGLRIGECLALREADVDLDAEVPTLTVTGTVVRADGRLVRQPKPKSDSLRRTIRLPTFVVAAIREALDLGLDGGSDGLVFPSTRATPRSPSRVRDQLREAQAAIGTTVTPHDFRRNVATQVANSTTIGNATALLGHADEGTTVRHYVKRTHVAPDLRIVIDQLVAEAAATTEGPPRPTLHTGAMVLQSGAQLADVDDPAWPRLRELIDTAPSTRALPVSSAQGLRTLESLQVTARSTLGALALNCGAITADHGWFRLLGGGGDGLPDLATANQLSPDNPTPPPYMLVGYDAVGGRFAIDGGGLGVAPGQVCYFGPDTLQWDGLGGGHSAFVEAVITGAMGETFADLRWSTWQRDVEALGPDQGFSMYPPPFSEEGRDLDNVSRRPVPLSELFAFYDEASAKL
ncbi:DUF2625 family protein [Oerskovia flava]|uniref:DUF2625 family protein n=1 Tax=Oerskovia flava TaxID=2986422 RepID=UPI00223EEC9F|nr:DUF2625 family protein [Oerskovia sp. JB1-3-2]